MIIDELRMQAARDRLLKPARFIVVLSENRTGHLPFSHGSDPVDQMPYGGWPMLFDALEKEAKQNPRKLSWVEEGSLYYTITYKGPAPSLRTPPPR